MQPNKKINTHRDLNRQINKCTLNIQVSFPKVCRRLAHCQYQSRNPLKTTWWAMNPRALSFISSHSRWVTADKRMFVDGSTTGSSAYTTDCLRQRVHRFQSISQQCFWLLLLAPAQSFPARSEQIRASWVLSDKYLSYKPIFVWHSASGKQLRKIGGAAISQKINQ